MQFSAGQCNMFDQALLYDTEMNWVGLGKVSSPGFAASARQQPNIATGPLIDFVKVHRGGDLPVGGRSTKSTAREGGGEIALLCLLYL